MQAAYQSRACHIAVATLRLIPLFRRDDSAARAWSNICCLCRPSFADGAEGSYDCGMSDNVFDMGTVRPLEALIRELGGLDECRRLGFVFEDEDGIMSLSRAGMGYLLFVKAAGITGVAEAFAAGYQCAAEEHGAKPEKGR